MKINSKLRPSRFPTGAPSVPRASAVAIRSSTPRRVPYYLGAASVALGLSAPIVASADPTDVLTANVSVNGQYDDNLFRLPDNVPATAIPGQTSRSDWMTLESVGLKLDKPYGQQEFAVQLDVDRTQFATYNYLDFTGVNATALWKWALTEDLTGDLSYARNQSLNSFADFTGFEQRNINTNENERFDLDYRFRGALHLAAAVYQFRQTNDQPVFALEDVRIDSFEPSIRYESRAGNSIGLYARTASGVYLDRALDPVEQNDTDFNEREAGIRLVWQIDGKSGLYAALGDLSRTHTHFSSRNFSGLVAQASYTLTLTGKTSIVASASRTLTSYETPTSSYVATDTFAVGPTWTPTAKTSLSLRLQDIRYYFRGPVAVSPGPLRDDEIQAINLLATYDILRALQLTVSYTHSNRSSNLAGLQFGDNLVTMGARFTF